jgi:hypothetical protein
MCDSNFNLMGGMPMRRAMSVACLAFVVIAAACSESTAPSSPLEGGWMAPRENLQPQGTMSISLAFSGSNFRYRANMYGIYAGNSPGMVSAYTDISGTYQIDGDKLVPHVAQHRCYTAPEGVLLMKTLTPAFKSHLAQEVTSKANCWQILRHINLNNGYVGFFVDADHLAWIGLTVLQSHDDSC